MNDKELFERVVTKVINVEPPPMLARRDSAIDLSGEDDDGGQSTVGSAFDGESHDDGDAS